MAESEDEYEYNDDFDFLDSEGSDVEVEMDLQMCDHEFEEDCDTDASESDNELEVPNHLVALSPKVLEPCHHIDKIQREHQQQHQEGTGFVGTTLTKLYGIILYEQEKKAHLCTISTPTQCRTG